MIIETEGLLRVTIRTVKRIQIKRRRPQRLRGEQPSQAGHWQSKEVFSKVNLYTCYNIKTKIEEVVAGISDHYYVRQASKTSRYIIGSSAYGFFGLKIEAHKLRKAITSNYYSNLLNN